MCIRLLNICSASNHSISLACCGVYCRTNSSLRNYSSNWWNHFHHIILIHTNTTKWKSNFNFHSYNKCFNFGNCHNFFHISWPHSHYYKSTKSNTFWNHSLSITICAKLNNNTLYSNVVVNTCHISKYTVGLIT